MRKPIVLLTATAGILAVGVALGQQSPSSSAPSAPQTPASGSSQSAAPKTTPKPPAAKSGASTSTTKKPAAPPLTLKTDKDKQSYALGMNMGEGMRKQSVDIDPAILYRGLKDGLAGGKTLLTDEEARSVLIALQNEVRKQQQEKLQAQSEANKKAGEAFLAANKAKEGVTTLPSGLQYKILQDGSGPKPAATDTVLCNYKGTLIDNTEFDSSYKRGQPATFPVTGVIKGWTEALQMMPVGSKWQLFIPSDLAYGARGGPGGTIGPNSTLVFEVELVSIQPKPRPAPQPVPGANANPAPSAPPNLNPGATPNPAPPAGSGANPNPNPAPNAPAKPNPPPNPTPTPTSNPTPN